MMLRAAGGVVDAGLRPARVRITETGRRVRAAQWHRLPFPTRSPSRLANMPGIGPLSASRAAVGGLPLKTCGCAQPFYPARTELAVPRTDSAPMSGAWIGLALS